MRYSPLDTEVAMLDDMTRAERMHYATSRMVESEEVWSLGNEDGWAIQERDGKAFIPLWPYRQFAQEYDMGDDNDLEPQATSLENFVFNVLGMCEDSEIWLDVFPLQGAEGYAMDAPDLFQILKGMLDTGEYFIEG